MWLETKLGIDTSETGGGQFDDKGYSVKVIYSSTDVDYDLK